MLYLIDKMSIVYKFLLIFLLRNGLCQQSNKRLLENNADATEARFRQLEISIQNLKTSITNLNNEIKTKDVQIGNLSATVSALQNQAHKSVAFTVVLTKVISIGPHQTVVFDKVINNIGNGYDVQDGEFNAPVSGIYIISVTIFNYASTILHTELVKNGIQIAAMYGEDDDDSGHTLSLVLNQNDKVWIRQFDDTDIRSLYSNPDRYYCSFSGALLVAL